MIVAELIARLQQLPPDARVLLDLPRNRTPVYADPVAYLDAGSAYATRVIISEAKQAS